MFIMPNKSILKDRQQLISFLNRHCPETKYYEYKKCQDLVSTHQGQPISLKQKLQLKKAQLKSRREKGLFSGKGSRAMRRGEAQGVMQRLGLV
jgi:hypothetical protein